MHACLSRHIRNVESTHVPGTGTAGRWAPSAYEELYREGYSGGTLGVLWGYSRVLTYQGLERLAVGLHQLQLRTAHEELYLREGSPKVIPLSTPL